MFRFTTTPNPPTSTTIPRFVFGSIFSTTVLTKFGEANPGIELQTYVFDTIPAGYKRMLEDGFDIVYTVEPFEATPSVHRRLLTKEPVYVLMSESHRLANNERVYQADLLCERFVSPKVNPVPEFAFSSALTDTSNIPKLGYDADNINETIELIRLNKGLFFSGKAFLLSLNLDGLVMRPFADCGYRMEHALYFRVGAQEENDTIMKTVDWLCANCKDLS